MPKDWFTSDFDASSWVNATTYTERQAGWGRAPYWYDGKCSQSTSPMTSEDLPFYAGNVDAKGVATEVIVEESDCLNPRTVLSDKGATFIWGKDLERDNTILLRYNAGNENTTWSKASSLVQSLQMLFAATALLSLY